MNHKEGSVSEQPEVEAGPQTALAVAAFRTFWIAALASNIGTWMQNTGASWLMVTLTDSPRMVALVSTASTLPVVLLGLPAGALADLLGRRRVLLSMQWAMLTVAALLGGLTLTGHVGPWSLLMLTFLLGLANAFSAPAWAAAVPEMVPPNLLSSAVTLNSVQFNAARAVGPAIAGMVLLATGAGGLFLMNAASFFGMIWVVRQWQSESRQPMAASGMMSYMREGVAWSLRDPTLTKCLIRSFLFVLAAAGPWALLPVIAKQHLHTTGGGFGLMLGAMGLGAVLIGLPFSVWRDRLNPDRILVTGAIAFAIGMFGITGVHTLTPALGLLLVMGASWLAVMTTFNVAAQRAIPNQLRARALSMCQLVFNLGFALASSFWGDVATRLGIERTLIYCGSAVVLTAFSALVWPLARDQVQESAIL